MLEDVAEPDESSPLVPMTTDERLVAEYHGTGVTVGPHPVFYRREELRQMEILSATELSAFLTTNLSLRRVP